MSAVRTTAAVAAVDAIKTLTRNKRRMEISMRGILQRSARAMKVRAYLSRACSAPGCLRGGAVNVHIRVYAAPLRFKANKYGLNNVLLNATASRGEEEEERRM